MTMLRDGLAAAEGNAAGVVSAVDIAELSRETGRPRPVPAGAGCRCSE